MTSDYNSIFLWVRDRQNSKRTRYILTFESSTKDSLYIFYSMDTTKPPTPCPIRFTKKVSGDDSIKKVGFGNTKKSLNVK